MYPKNTWVRVNAARALLPGPLRQLRLAPPAQVRAPHHVRSLQVLKAASALRQARLAGGGADDAVVPTSSATLARGLHRRVDPLAERQGALAAHASRQGLPEVLAFFWHPHHIAHHPRECTGSLHCLLCAAAFWCSTTSLHAAQANGPSLPFIALRPVSAPPSERVGVWSRDNSGLW